MESIAPLHRLDESIIRWRREAQAEMYLSERTIEKYRRNLESYAAIATARGCRAWRDVDRSCVMAYLSAGEPSPATSRLRLASLRTFHRFLSTSEGVPDPSAGIRRAKLKQAIPDSLTEPEVAAMLAACEDGTWFGVRDRALLELAFSTGARSSELTGICLADVREADGSVLLHGKGAKDRLAYLTESCAAALQSWRVARTTVAPPSCPYLFVSAALGRFSAMGLWKVIVKRAEIAGIQRRVHPHMLRHTFATHLLRHGADLRAIQLLLGHASIATTQVYLRADDAWLRATHERCHQSPSEGARRDEGTEAVQVAGMPRKEGVRTRKVLLRPAPADVADDRE